MKPATVLALGKGANEAYKYFRKNDQKQQREIYSSLLENLKSDGSLDDLHDNLEPEELERLFGAARANAGDITRDMHDRLDRRRANFAATAPARKKYREELLKEADAKKKKGSSTIGSIFKWTLGLGAVAGGAWALWEFLLKDKFDGDDTTYKPAPTREEKAANGSSTLVYSTRTEDAREAAAREAGRTDGIEDGGVHPADNGGGKHELIDDTTATDPDTADLGREGLSTLDTLDDDQRKATGGNKDK